MNEIIRPYDIMIVGESWDRHDDDSGAPFSGPAGNILRAMLRNAGIPYDDCYVTNVFNFMPPNNKIENLGAPKSEAVVGWPQCSAKLWISAKYQSELTRLWDEIELIKPTVIIALGATALWALTKNVGIKKFRGTPLQTFQGEYKVLPTYHPSMVFRQWKIRPIVIADLAKARKESLFRELIRPQRFIHIEPSIDDIAEFYETYIKPRGLLSTDIETKQGTITEIGFATSHDRALVIPFYTRAGRGGNYWATAEEEFQAWKWVRRIIAENAHIGQNFSYDLQYLWDKNHLPVLEVEDDTMILHHALYPEMEKSLGFLGSIYTNEASWKFMRADNETLKKED